MISSQDVSSKITSEAEVDSGKFLGLGLGLNNIAGNANGGNGKQIKLNIKADVDPGYNSIDSDSGSPISNKEQRVNMFKHDNQMQNKDENGSLQATSGSVESNKPKIETEQSLNVEQHIVDKIRRRAASISDEHTPSSFLQLHLGTSDYHVTNKYDDEPIHELGVVKQAGKEKEINSLANIFDESLVIEDKAQTKTGLIAKGPHEKRRFDGIRVNNYSGHVESVYAPANQNRRHTQPLLPVVGSEGSPTLKRIYVHGSSRTVYPSALMIPPSSQGHQSNMLPQCPQNTTYLANSYITMLPPTPPNQLRDYELSCWPATSITSRNTYPADAPIPTAHYSSSSFPGSQQQSPYSNIQATSVVSVTTGNSNVGRVYIKHEPLSPLSPQSNIVPCPYDDDDDDDKKQAIESIKAFLIGGGSDDTSGTNIIQSIPSASVYDTPPPSVGSKCSGSPSPQSTDAHMIQHEPIFEKDSALDIMEYELHVNKLSIENLLEQDAEDKDTCLHVVVTQGRYPLAHAIAKRLSQRTGALDVQNNLGQTPLFLATVVNMHHLVKDLIILGADPSLKDNNGCSPLHYAAMKGFAEIISAIYIGLDSRPNSYDDFDVDLKDYDGKTALHYAVEHHERYETVFSAQSGHANKILVVNNKLVNTLLYMNASTTSQDGKSGKTPLHYAVELQKRDLIDILLDCDQPCVNMQTFSGCTPLHLAVGLKADESIIVDIVRMLMRKGADVSKENVEKEKPIGLNPRKHLDVRKLLSGR